MNGASDYVLGDDAIERFERDGYVHLPGVLSPAEVDEIEDVYERFLRREIPVAGRDFCDMAGDYARAAEDFSIVNIMLPRRYYPEWQGNPFERRTAAIARQLCGPGMQIDYDQLVAKPPGKTDAVFRWHQDLAYWPATTDPRTATFWLAVDASTPENGCMRFVPGSHKAARLRPHRSPHGDREQSHVLYAELAPDDVVRETPIARGDVTVHSERVLHGSGGNRSDGWRRAYVVAYRSEATIGEERAMGFTHSHNDAPDVLDSVGE